MNNNGSGTRLRNIVGDNLEELEAFLQAMPYKVEIVSVNRLNSGTWFIHFVLPQNAYEALLPQNEQVIEEQKKNKRK